LVKLNVAPALIDQVLTLVGSTRNDVLNLGPDATLEDTASVEESSAGQAEAPIQTVSEEKAREVANQTAAEAPGATGAESNIANQSSRVSVQLLQNLMTTVSELVLTGNQLLQMVRSSEDSEVKAPLLRDVIEAMTTNESFFFRDTTPFDKFRKLVLPAILEAHAEQKRLRIWCAACSNGREPYSLAMILREETARLAGWRIEIVGTDLSREVLEKRRPTFTRGSR